MALHERPGKTDEWYTPPYVFDALGCTFDLDVASLWKIPWIPATSYLSPGKDGLKTPWEGFVWMNPPFGGRNGLTPWLDKFVKHGNGIALIPDRTSAPWWQDFVPESDSVLFVSPKIKFIDINGELGMSPAQGTCLVGIGPSAFYALRRAFEHNLGSLFYPARQLDD